METVSEDQISEPTTAQYRTVPWRPHNVTFDPTKIGPDSFEVSWSGPREITEFDRYQVAIGIRRKTPQIIERGAPLTAKFTENLKPGRTYQVINTDFFMVLYRLSNMDLQGQFKDATVSLCLVTDIFPHHFYGGKLCTF